MRAVCVDDEMPALQAAVSMCRAIPALGEVTGFTSPSEALEWLAFHPADVAVLDIEMPGMSGILLARKIMERQPGISVIFLTEHPEYAVEAFAMHVSGYLIKPASPAQMAREMNYALNILPEDYLTRTMVKTFGNFDVLVNEKLVAFRRSKAKELLAYLVDRQGSSITRAEAFRVLWEEGDYDRPMQKQLDVIIRSLKKTLQEYGISNILEIQNGNMRICPDRFECDLYQFLEGDSDAMAMYRGEYMSSYSWASLTEAYLTRKDANKRNKD